MTTHHIAPEIAERNLSNVPEIGLTEIDGQPRARDIEIAERLGMSRPRDIRQLIERNLVEIEGFGPARRRTAMVGIGSGAEREVEEFWLNEEQALLVATLSKAPHAPAVRAMLIRCFVAWRRGHFAAPALPAEAMEMIRRDDGISRMLAHKVTEQGKALEEQNRALVVMGEQMKALIEVVQPAVPGIVIRHGKTAGAILKAAGIANCPRNFAKWFADRLEAAGCRVDGYVDTSVCRARLFDPDKAEHYLKNGGMAAVEKKLDERKGQGMLGLKGAHRAAAMPAIPPEMDTNGIGAIMVDGAPVYFDIRVSHLEADARYVVINVKGDVIVDTPACSMAGRNGTMGPRGVLTSPRMEAVPGRRDPVPTQWEGVILGKVIERKNVVRLPNSDAPRWPSHPHVWERVLPEGASPMIDTLRKSEKLPDGSLAMPVIGGGYTILPPQHGRHA